MLRDVLANAGVVELRGPSRTQQALRASQVVAMIVCVAMLTTGSCYLAVTAESERESERRDTYAAAGLSEQVVNRYGASAAGAFRP
jgi:hypothetical protein